ncbi:MAG TPA: MotA/TolQ/ExbB proton channel family protein, partial [Opitutales bacterium]|nr:MotA/TolQ/ExbB proton channel family protein [Opitutales bacterium]
FHKGGLLMWPLMLCSVVGLAVVCDRAWVLIGTSQRFGAFIQRLKAHLHSNQARQRPQWLSKRPTSAGIVTDLYYRYLEAPVAKRNEALKREGMRHLEDLGCRLRLLAAVAQVSPLLGLLGTVTGLVAAFASIEALGGRVQPTDLAGGIWEALITTVVGLTIGIPCLLAQQFFQAKIDRRAHEMTQAVSELDEAFAHDADEVQATFEEK